MAQELNETTSLLPRASSSTSTPNSAFFSSIVTQQRRRAVFSGGLILSLLGALISSSGYFVNKNHYEDRNSFRIVDPWLFPLVLFAPAIFVFLVLLCREFLKTREPLPNSEDFEALENLPKNGCFGY
jgi:hypothetical protein